MGRNAYMRTCNRNGMRIGMDDERWVRYSYRTMNGAMAALDAQGSKDLRYGNAHMNG